MTAGKSLLLHSCCAPCAAYVCDLLKDSFDVTLYFYNPNIAPRAEYEIRLDELRRFSAGRALPLVEGERRARDWTAAVKQYRFMGERSERCRSCIRFRLEGAFAHAKEHGHGVVATTLSISPHKDAGMINETGKELDLRYGIEFLPADFKKDGGFRRSVEISRAFGFYRQHYCGCMYSKLERDKSSSWHRKYVKKLR